MTTQRMREAVANQGSHWLTHALLRTRMDLGRDFSPARAIVAALIRAELHRRGIPTR